MYSSDEWEEDTYDETESMVCTDFGTEYSVCITYAPSVGIPSSTVAIDAVWRENAECLAGAFSFELTNPMCLAAGQVRLFRFDALIAVFPLHQRGRLVFLVSEGETRESWKTDKLDFVHTLELSTVGPRGDTYRGVFTHRVDVSSRIPEDLCDHEL